MKKLHKNSKKKFIIPLVIVLAIIALGAAAGVVCAMNRNNPAADQSKQEKSGSNENTIIPDTNDPNDKPDTDSDASPKPPSDNVGVVIVDASQYDNIFEIRAYANATESGTCSYTFTSGSKTVTKQTDANSGPSTASCNTLEVPVSELGIGTWDITIDYASTSKNYTGTTKLTATIK